MKPLRSVVRQQVRTACIYPLAELRVAETNYGPFSGPR